MKKGFTLVEILVVIAIISILAAFMFPVFASAKISAARTQTISSFKQVSVATTLYSADNDNKFPLSFAWNGQTASWRIGSLVAIPQGSIQNGGRGQEPRKSEEGSMVLNAIQPYLRSYAALAASQRPVAQRKDIVFMPGSTPMPVNTSFNGLLHAWNEVAVTDPSRCPLYWNGNFAANTLGFSITNPQLACNATGVSAQGCIFNPSGSPQKDSMLMDNVAYNWYWMGGSAAKKDLTTHVYAESMIVISTDTSARSISMSNLPIWPEVSTTNVNDNPFSSADPDGVKGAPGFMTNCVSPGVQKGNEPYYPGFFRPDSTYTYGKLECDFGER